MSTPPYEIIARRYAGRRVTVADIANALGVNETVARAVVADLKVMKLAKGERKNGETTFAISPEHCLDAMRIGRGA